MRKKRRKVTNIYEAMVHVPLIISSIGSFVAGVREPHELDAKLKERIILRVSKSNGSANCYHAHQQISKKMGFSDNEIKEEDNPIEAHISDAEMVTLRYAEEKTINLGNVTASPFEELKYYFSESQIVELTALISYYNMIKRFSEALELDPEDW